MAITSTTIANTLQMRAELERYVIESELKLARMWGTAWREISDEYALAVADLVDMAEVGDWPTRTQVLRAQRVENALKVTLDQMQALVPASATAMQDNLATITASAQHWSERIVRSQLPTHGISQVWSRVDVGAMDAIVKRSTGRIHSLTQPLTRDMVTQMKATLIRGVAVGENPRAAARQIMRRCEQTFNGGRARALNIARTELLDSHRAAALRSRTANSDVVKGWRWHCTFSPRTCPSCLAQHGSLHKVDELGPLDHQQGRCTSIPVTKTWRELGIDQDEAADEFPDARAWFAQQSRETKLRIMGAERLRRLESGQIVWDDLSQLRHTNGWRDSFNVAPLGPSTGTLTAPKPVGFDPAPFRNAQSVTDLADELQRVMGDRGKVLGIDATSAKWELDRVKDVSETVAELFHRFPEVKADVEFAKMSSKYLAQATAQMTPMRSEFGQLTLKINKGKLSARSKFAEDWDRDVKSGFYNVRQAEDVKAMQWITRHEFGHILDYTQAKVHGGGEFGMIPTRSIAFKEAEKRGWFGGGSEAAEWKRSQAGKYARSNDAEMLAEAFADVQTYGDNARDLSKAIVKELMSKLGRSS